MSVTIAADAAGNSAAFSSTSKPSQRSLTTATATYTDNTNWSANTWYTSGDLSAVIQELVNRPDWSGGNSLSLILKGNGSAYSRKFIKSYEGGAATAPRIVITYR
jgi:type IV pilus assembly protein PilY1